METLSDRHQRFVIFWKIHLGSKIKIGSWKFSCNFWRWNSIRKYCLSMVCWIQSWFFPDLEPNHFFLFPYVKKRHLEKRFLLIMHSLEIFESEWKKFFNNWCFSIINICIPEKSNSHIILVKFWIEEVKLTFRYSELNYWMYWMKNNAPSKRENFPEISPLTSSAGCRSHKIT